MVTETLLALHLKLPSHVPLSSFLHFGHAASLVISLMQHDSLALPALGHPFPHEGSAGTPTLP